MLLTYGVVTLLTLWCCMLLFTILTFLNSSADIQNIVQPILLPFPQQECEMLVQYDNVQTYDICAWAMFCLTTNVVGMVTKLVQLVYLQLLLYCVNRYKRHEIMYCRMVFTICTIIWMQSTSLCKCTRRIYKELICIFDTHLVLTTVHVLIYIRYFHFLLKKQHRMMNKSKNKVLSSKCSCYY